MVIKAIGERIFMATYFELEKLQKAHLGEVCIFGAGLLGKYEGYELIKTAGFHVDFYCDNNIASGTIVQNEIRVKELEYLYDNKENVLVFLCMASKYQHEVLEQIKSHGVTNVVVIDFDYIFQVMESIESANDEIKQKYHALYNDIEYLKTKFKRRTGYDLNLENPQTFNEKLQWLKLHDRKKEYTRMVDKYEFKKYIETTMGSEYVIPTLALWESVEEIDFDKLPNQFVLKCTHDSESVVICRNKDNFAVGNTIEKLGKCLQRNYYWNNREWPYKDVKPRIIAEEYMQDGERKELRDYKFYCFNGQPRFIYISEGLENHSTARISFIAIEEGKWEFAPFRRIDFAEFEELPEKPVTYTKMLEIAKTLSKDCPFVRVDLYEINGQVYVSEITFTPGGGMTKIVPEEWDEILGSYIQL